MTIPDDTATGVSDGSFARLLAHPFTKAAAKHFSTRAALMALCFFFLATAGLRQMEAACQKSVVKAGRYSLVETSARQWLAPEMRVGWKNREAYIGFSDFALLEAVALARITFSTLMYLNPARVACRLPPAAGGGGRGSAGRRDCRFQTRRRHPGTPGSFRLTRE